MSKPQRLNLDGAREIAREATRGALEACKARGLEIPSDSDALTLGARPEGECYVFELYEAAERPEDARRFTETTVNRLTGEVQVRVFEEHLRSV